MTNPVIKSDGTMCWYKDNQLHRVKDLPAVISFDGTRYWFQNGVLHREEGPAIVWADGTKAWFKNGKQILKLI